MPGRDDRHSESHGNQERQGSTVGCLPEIDELTRLPPNVYVYYIPGVDLASNRSSSQLGSHRPILSIRESSHNDPGYITIGSPTGVGGVLARWMDGWLEGWPNRWMGVWVGGRTDGWVVEQMDGPHTPLNYQPPPPTRGLHG